MTEHNDAPARDPAQSDGELEVEPQAPDSSARQGAVVGKPYREVGTFDPGALIIERFKILRYIARGGSGEVYEAFDTELRCPVALKVVRPELAANQSAMDRFRREIALARQVTHPNVCRLFDVFRDEGTALDGSRVETLFLTMELLVGESLAARLQGKGPLTTDEALPLIEDLVAGLEAAHRAGVIHRDFKSANVVLVREEERPRAVITDFGLAQVTDPDDPSPLTQSGTVVGTPNYMAPEQITGDVVTPAVDQYALGIVMYEMLTGLRPFRGHNDLSTAVKRLTEPAPSPRTLLPDLESRWEHTVLRCLERNPKDRFPSVDDVRATLIGKIEVGPFPSRNTGARRGFLIAAAAILILALAAGFRLSSTLSSIALGVTGNAVPSSSSRDPVLAVFDFQNLAGEAETEWLSTALPEMINMELASAGGLDPVPDSEVDRVAAGLGLGAEHDFDRQAILDVRRRLTASHIVEGSYFARPEEDGVRLHLRVYDGGRQQRILVVGRESQLADLVKEASSRLRLAIGLDSARPTPGLGLTVEDALLLVGREELRNLSYQAARQIFRRALDDNPDSALARSLYARALDSLGDLEAPTEARSALSASAELPRGQQLEIEAHAAFIERRYEDAAERFGALHRFYPDDPDFGRAWTESLIAGGRWQRALEVLAPSEDEGAELDFGELLLVARAAGSGRRFEQQLEAARSAAQDALSRGASAAAAQSELEQSRASTGLGELDQGADLAESAEQRFRSLTLIRGVLDALEQRARIADLMDQSERAESLRSQADSLAKSQRRSGGSGESAGDA